MTLSDPRRYGDGTTTALAQLAERGAGAELAAAVAAALEAGRDGEIAAAYRAVTGRGAYRVLWEAVASALEAAPPGAALATRVFAMPWLLVCGTRAGATLPCVVKDTGPLVRVLEEAGALGANRNLGFGNALTGLETLEALPPSVILAWREGGGARDLPPAPLELTPGDESVHLRFLLGAAIAPPHAAGIADTATNVSAWGMKATAAMAQQLAVPGVDVLPVPRPPASVMRAAYAGRRAALEAAFQLFMSNTLRRFRMKVGDPRLVLSAHEGGELRVTLCSPLDEGMTEGYRWPLHPLDAIDDVASAIGSFAHECRVTDTVALPGILPGATATGAVLFPTGPAAGSH